MGILSSLNKSHARAISFPFVLFLSVLLFAIGLGFLAFVQRDAKLQLQALRTNEAFTLARSGLDFFSFRRIENPTWLTPGSSAGPIAIEPGKFFLITANQDGGATCRGWIESSGQVVAERTLVIPGNHIVGGDRRAIFDPTM